MLLSGEGEGRITPSRGEETPNLLDPRDAGAAAQAGAFQRRNRIGKLQYIPSLPPLQQPVQKRTVEHVAGPRGVTLTRSQGLNNLIPVPKAQPRPSVSRRTPDQRAKPKDIPLSCLPVSIR
jgi:hypothetical protein